MKKKPAETVPDLDDLGMPATDDPDGQLMSGGKDELVFGL